MGGRAVVVAIAALLIASGPAVAQSGVPSGGQSARDADRVPSAHLQASGRGTITVVGRLAVNGSIPRRARVVVVDRAGDAEARLAGAELPFGPRGRAVVRAASGILFVTGSRVLVRVRGPGLSFSIAGVGRARLHGVGRYRLNGARALRWVPRWIALRPPGRAPLLARGA